ncbi:aspartate/glutamate racemase family protein [Rhizobium sp. GN54]|uniref:aspartate/glutamate racemase family protein n=1 Tax=Rhizobium sp. GN54 TaxID=2898150 RepID=UPI001E62199B|nr:aspartate/glutamate racemase family protein [Rhizobium sp. GN54]MCD2182828.1 aspartate/glutamate racemase family protein [Rhizobium sp. GN54]
MKSRPRIVLYHATPVAMEPVISSMARLWPEAEAVNLLDDGLTIDRAKEGSELSDELTGRFLDFGRYAHRIGADGILVTCSAFGPAIEKMADELPVPVLKPNEAMFRDAIAAGGRIGMLATFAPAVSTMTEEFSQFAADTGAAATLDTIVVADAIDLLRKGDAAAHNRLVAARAPELARHDAIMLAHFSTSRAAEAVRAVVDVPVLSAPDAAVLRMRALLNGEG